MYKRQDRNKAKWDAEEDRFRFKDSEMRERELAIGYGHRAGAQKPAKQAAVDKRPQLLHRKPLVCLRQGHRPGVIMKQILILLLLLRQLPSAVQPELLHRPSAWLPLP